MKRKMLATLLTMAMCLSVPAVVSAEENDGYVKDSITVANSADGGSFDPFGGFINWGQSNLTNLMIEHLVIVDFDYNIYYNLAKEITQEDDTHWTVTIYDTIYDDPDKAAELLEEAGYNGETIRVMYVSSTANDGAAIMVQSQLSKLGINVELNQVDQTVAEDKKYDSTAWDIRFDLMGGGAYMSQTTKMFWSEDIKDHVEGGLNSAMVADAQLDELYVAMKNDASEENIAAWDEYFNSMAYGYAICVYANQTACSLDLQSVVLSNNGGVVANALVLAE